MSERDKSGSLRPGWEKQFNLFPLQDPLLVSWLSHQLASGFGSPEVSTQEMVVYFSTICSICASLIGWIGLKWALKKSLYS